MLSPGSRRPGSVGRLPLLARLPLVLVVVVSLSGSSARAGDLDASSWSARVDPPARPVPPPSATNFAIPFPGNFGGGGEVVYPAVPSPFVVIGKNFFPNDIRQVWDLASKKQIGQFKGPLGFDDKQVALSGDGAYLAGKASNRPMVEVRQTRNGRVAQSFDTHSPFVDFVEFAGNDRVIFGRLGDRKLDVAAIQGGDKVCELQLAERVERDGVTFSPGGAYLATASSGDGRLQIHDLKTGEVVGEAPTPREKIFVFHCHGLGFSPDGTELAGLFESFNVFHLVIWDAATGRMVDRFDLGKTVSKPAFYKDRGVDYFPDKSALLVLGYAVVDRHSGKKVWNLPFDDKNLKVGPRHFLDNGHAVVVSHSPGMALRTAEIPRDRIASATAIVRDGGNAADAALPPLKAVDLASAPHAGQAPPSGAWSLAPGSAPTPRRLTARTITLKNKADEARGLLFAGGSSTVAAVVGTPDRPGAADANEGQPRWLERFDLANSKPLGAVELPAAVNPIALSPDGAQVLVREAKLRDRLDLFAASDAKPIVGWRPFGSESGDDRAVVWADFAAGNRVVTINSAGTLVAWSLPDLKAAYVVDDAFQGAPALTSDRTRLVGFSGRAVRVIDAATGSILAEGAPAPSLGARPDWKGGAVRPDGGAVAGRFGGETLVVWDLATGRVTTEVRATAPLPTEGIEWVGDRHVLLGNRTLVDLPSRRVVWEFTGAPVGAGGPNGQHWFVARPERGAEGGRLLGMDAAPPSVLKAEAQLANASGPAVLRPGAKVSIRVDATGPPTNPDAWRKAVTEALARRLKASGLLVVDAGATVGLVLAVRQTDTGKTMEFQGIGPGMRGVETVHLVNLDCDLSLTEVSGGSVPCGTTFAAPMRPFGFILHLPAGETLAEPYLRRHQWDRIRDWASTANPPYFVARDGAEIVRLPGFTDLNKD